MPPRPLNATAASLLGFLHEGPRTGWDLVATAQQRIGDYWTITQSQVYRELASMAANGLVAVGEPGPRDRKPYTLTDAGREAFAAWIVRDPGLEQIRFPLLLTMNFARHLPPDRLREIVERQRVLHAERLAGYERQASALPADRSTLSSDDRYRAATLDFGLRYERAVVDWFDGLDVPAVGVPAVGEPVVGEPVVGEPTAPEA